MMASGDLFRKLRNRNCPTKSPPVPRLPLRSVLAAFSQLNSPEIVEFNSGKRILKSRRNDQVMIVFGGEGTTRKMSPARLCNNSLLLHRSLHYKYSETHASVFTLVKNSE